MSTQAQILANQANAQKSCGPKTETGKQASSQNRRIHGLSDSGDSFTIESYEDGDEFIAFKLRLYREHNPQDETECILVRRMIESEWLRRRAILLQTVCYADGFLREEKHFALYLRYQTSHERGFYKALNELQKLRNEKRKEQIGFESQKRAEAAENRAAETHNFKKQEFELKKERAARLDQTKKSEKESAAPAPNPETSPGDLEMAAIIADNGYATRDNVEQTAERNAELVAPWKDDASRQAGACTRTGIAKEFAAVALRRQARGKELLCPDGKTLLVIGQKKHHGMTQVMFQAKATDCHTCRFRQKCGGHRGGPRRVEVTLESKAMRDYLTRMKRRAVKTLYKKRCGLRSLRICGSRESQS